MLPVVGRSVLILIKSLLHWRRFTCVGRRSFIRHAHYLDKKRKRSGHCALGIAISLPVIRPTLCLSWNQRHFARVNDCVSSGQQQYSDHIQFIHP